MTRISVLLPYRNCETTIAEALSSVLEDRALAGEVICVDDGSTDRSRCHVEASARRDPRIVSVRTTAARRGLVAALHVGMATARGDYIARMDGDDISLPTRLAKQASLLDARPTIAAIGTQVEGFGDQPLGEGLCRYIDWQNSLLTEADHCRDLFVESPLCHPSVMLRRAAIDAVGGYVERPWAEDYDVWLRLHRAGFGIAKLPEVLLRWRHHSGRQSFTNPTYALERFRDAKAYYLAPILRDTGRPIAFWGAGPTGKRFARALEPFDVRPTLFVDIDPRKVGSTARGVPIGRPSDLLREEHFVVVAVGTPGARDEVRTHLRERGWTETADFVCVA